MSEQQSLTTKLCTLELVNVFSQRCLCFFVFSSVITTFLLALRCQSSSLSWFTLLNRNSPFLHKYKVFTTKRKKFPVFSKSQNRLPTKILPIKHILPQFLKFSSFWLMFKIKKSYKDCFCCRIVSINRLFRPPY